jgi:hypothetical protein
MLSCKRSEFSEDFPTLHLRSQVSIHPDWKQVHFELDLVAKTQAEPDARGRRIHDFLADVSGDSITDASVKQLMPALF